MKIFHAFSLALIIAAPLRSPAQAPRPNIIFILADDLGYGDLGCYGQKKIRTPNLDRMASEGMRFTQFYAGATVCAPSRSVFMTGQHTGHTRVRGNSIRARGPQTLRANDPNIAKTLHAASYATGLVGKWGLGEEATSGHPNAQGFDSFFGFLDQVHAHNHFPAFLWRDSTRVPLQNVVKPVGNFGGGVATTTVQFADDLIADEALAFVERHRSEPFFLYWSAIIPHGNGERVEEGGLGVEAPDDSPYGDTGWSEAERLYAATITRLDSYVGRLLSRLKELGLDENTLVIFTSDNGPAAAKETSVAPAFFNSNGSLRGLKRDLYEGGIRVPLIARWPGKIAFGMEPAHVAYFGDCFATFSEIAGAPLPTGLDSISFAPTLFGRAENQSRHDALYWEFHERGFSQAALLDGRWKAIRMKRPDAPLELYDLQSDLTESHDTAAAQPAIAARAAAFLRDAHTDTPDWPIKPAPIAP